MSHLQERLKSLLQKSLAVAANRCAACQARCHGQPQNTSRAISALASRVSTVQQHLFRMLNNELGAASPLSV